MIGNAKTFKLTVAQVRLFLNLSSTPHHMTAKAIRQIVEFSALAA